MRIIVILFATAGIMWALGHHFPVILQTALQPLYWLLAALVLYACHKATS